MIVGEVATQALEERGGTPRSREKREETAVAERGAESAEEVA